MAKSSEAKCIGILTAGGNSLGLNAAIRGVAKGKYQRMVAYRSGHAVDVPLEEVAGKRKTVPLDHPMLETARLVGTCLGVKNA